MRQIALALILGLSATIARADEYGIFFNDNFPSGDPLAQRDEWALLHQGKAVNATDFAPRYHWRWIYYFKAPEQLILQPAYVGSIGNFLRVLVVSIDARKIDRATLSTLPSRFVFRHHILPIEVKENSVVLATYDLFNSIGRQLAAQLLKKPAEWVLVPRAQLL